MSIFNVNKLQRGDILASSRNNSLIGDTIEQVTKSPWSHVFIYIGDEQIIESTGLDGVHCGDISKYYSPNYDNIVALRFKPHITSDQIDKMIEVAKSKIGIRYGYFQIIYIWFVTVILRKIKSYFWQREVDGGMICSELVARCANSADIKLFDKSASMVTPADFVNNDNFILVDIS